MKTKGMSHQIEALRTMESREYFALLMEQGTGKTWTILADTERLYAQGEIDALFVVAPKGVHTNWIYREIPEHMDIPVISRAWRSGAGKRYMAKMEDLFKPREHGEIVPLRVLSMNIDALITKDGFAFAQRFLNATNALFAIDESSRIKNIDTGRNKQVMKLQHMAKYRRIATGTPITNAPVDIFGQFEFLSSGLLGTTSYRAFVAEYAELMSNEHPMMKNLIQRNPRAAQAQIIARNPDGSPRWRNLDKLQKLIQPHSFRVLKRDCLNLPEKIYKNHYFELDTKQLRAYELMKDEFRLELNGEQIPVSALAALVKMQQITSGFTMLPGTGDLVYVSDKNPRLAALLELIQDIDGQFIIWARFIEEIKTVARALREAGLRVVEYYGEIKDAAREIAVDSFQRGEVDVFIGQPKAGGIGLTLTNAETVIYYSNDFNSETRKQSEDRAHRIGTKKNVVYIDIVAENTIDESIARALQRKENLAATILGDLRNEKARDN